MAVFRMAKPNVEDAYLAGRIERWLANKGYAIGPDGVTVTDTEVVVDTDRDPAADVATYQYTELAEENGVALATASLRNAISDIRARAPAQRSPAERAVLALVVILRELREEGV